MPLYQPGRMYRVTHHPISLILCKKMFLRERERESWLFLFIDKSKKTYKGFVIPVHIVLNQMGPNPMVSENLYLCLRS